MELQESCPSWSDFFQSQESLPYFRQLDEFVRREREQYIVYPPKDAVFNAFKETPLEKVRVVIVGQDPYHGPNQAHGLSFSVKKGVPIPPSLKNIFQESGGCQDSDLTRWAHQGVLLLNSVLTVRHKEAFSHKNRGWERFTDEALRYLQEATTRKDPIIYLLWGNPAWQKVDRALKGLNGAAPVILKAPHPSPLSAYRGFFGCGHFQKVNEILTGYGERPGEKPIMW